MQFSLSQKMYHGRFSEQVKNMEFREVEIKIIVKQIEKKKSSKRIFKCIEK